MGGRQNYGQPSSAILRRDMLFFPHVEANGVHLINRDLLKARACSPNSSLPRPFLRWAGSKRRLMNQIIPFIPSQFHAYHEPFLGSGALFFLLCPSRAWLSDKCDELINVYKILRDSVSSIIRYLRPLKPDRDLFYAFRNQPSRGKFKRVAEFLYLNKTCWNGLYRVNSKGHYNVPYGMPRTNFIANFDNLRACSLVLRKPSVSLQSGDFEEALAKVQAGDLVYLDPPYITRHNNGFVDYNETLFSWKDQKRLAKRGQQLASAGAYVIVSNADNNEVRELYRGFKYGILRRPSTLASNPQCRVRVTEAILYSPNCINGQ
jgi:DNA adenine methylase